MRLGLGREGGAAQPVGELDALLDNEEWLRSHLPDLIEVGVQAREAGQAWKMCVAQTIRRQYQGMSEKAKKRLRRYVYVEVEDAGNKDRPGWARGSAFDEHREHKRRQSESSRRGHRTSKERGTALKHKPTRAAAYADQSAGVPLASAHAEPVRVVVEGPWGRLSMTVEPAADGTVQVTGRLGATEAMAWLQSVLERPGSRLITNRLRG